MGWWDAQELGGLDDLGIPGQNDTRQITKGSLQNANVVTIALTHPSMAPHCSENNNQEGHIGPHLATTSKLRCSQPSL